jgi:hypothetical protein
MTAAANNNVGRSEAVRWTVCFAVVVAAHALAALSLFPTLEASEFEAGAPVIMLEPPAAPAAPSTPPDLAPGPPEEQSDPTPPPKEETKPIEQEAEVALPTPEPPKPEPPVEQHEATATPSVELPPSAAVVPSWSSQMMPGPQVSAGEP